MEQPLIKSKFIRVYKYWEEGYQLCLVKGPIKKDPDFSDLWIVSVDSGIEVYVEYNEVNNHWEFIDGYLSLL